MLNTTPCTVASIGGHTFERKAPFVTTSFKRGRRSYFQDITVIDMQVWNNNVPAFFTETCCVYSSCLSLLLCTWVSSSDQGRDASLLEPVWTCIPNVDMQVGIIMLTSVFQECSLGVFLLGTSNLCSGAAQSSLSYLLCLSHHRSCMRKSSVPAYFLVWMSRSEKRVFSKLRSPGSSGSWKLVISNACNHAR